MRQKSLPCRTPKHHRVRPKQSFCERPGSNFFLTEEDINVGGMCQNKLAELNRVMFIRDSLTEDVVKDEAVAQRFKVELVHEHFLPANGCVSCLGRSRVLGYIFTDFIEHTVRTKWQNPNVRIVTNISNDKGDCDDSSTPEGGHVYTALK